MMGDSQNILSNIQPILENNEDIIAAILENVQIGRLDDCVKHYGILQSNLMSLSQELDNYPPCDVDLYSDVILNRGLFPDEIMRKDILDDLNYVRGDAKRGASSHSLPGRCPACTFAEQSEVVCRLELGHTEPPGKFTATERSEFAKAAYAITARLENYDSKNGRCVYVAKEERVVDAKKKRIAPKPWQANEIYSLLLAIQLFGRKNFDKLSEMIDGRSPFTIRSFLYQNLSNVEMAAIEQGKLPLPPSNFVPTQTLARYLELQSQTSLEQHQPTNDASLRAGNNSSINNSAQQTSQETRPNNNISNNTDTIPNDDNNTGNTITSTPEAVSPWVPIQSSISYKSFQSNDISTSIGNKRNFYHPQQLYFSGESSSLASIHPGRSSQPVSQSANISTVVDIPAAPSGLRKLPSVPKTAISIPLVPPIPHIDTSMVFANLAGGVASLIQPSTANYGRGGYGHDRPQLNMMSNPGNAYQAQLDSTSAVGNFYQTQIPYPMQFNGVGSHQSSMYEINANAHVNANVYANGQYYQPNNAMSMVLSTGMNGNRQSNLMTGETNSQNTASQRSKGLYRLKAAAGKKTSRK